MKIQLVGMGTIGKSVYQAFKSIPGLEIVNFVVEEKYFSQDKDHNLKILEDTLDSKIERAIPYVVTLGYADQNMQRERLITKILKAGGEVINLIHPDAYVSGNTNLGIGNVIMPRVVLDSNVIIGNGCVIWSNVLVGHDVKLGNHIFIAGGSVIGGNTTLDNNCTIGLNATVGNSLTVGQNSIIGAGALVTKNISPNSVRIRKDTEQYILNSTDFNRFSHFN
jgi:sugar O-acyltransferase (sialic acid O-acetyltransferase NeuD family)